nr:5659_t:CDS:2 [Entrophospora candida]
MTDPKEQNSNIIELTNNDLEKRHDDNNKSDSYLSSVIYGDIGTSPLYTINTIFTNPPADEKDVLGAVSLIIWSLTILPMIKYIFIILRADDNGMGGTFALYSLICRHSSLSVRGKERSDDLTIMNYDSKSIHSLKDKKNIISGNKFVQNALLILVLLGASLIMSDGLLTPAISVISAVEGMAVPAPGLTGAIVPLSCTIIVLLFLGQKFGTSKVGALFAPIVSLWFLSLAIIGAWNISQYPQVLKAFNPQYAFEYFIRNGEQGYNSLGGVLLAVTGVEALYADLGHFSRKSIQLSFPLFVYVPLVMAYSGQAGRLILEPELINGPLFWLTIPQNQVIYWIVFVLATLATIIASQAMITATFSLIHQAMQLDCFPRVRVIHTSKTVHGQIYIPEINYILMIATVLVCVAFQKSANLTNAYGVAVITVVFISTILVSIVIRIVWNLPLIVSIMFLLIFGVIDVSFMGATFLKVQYGGWFTLVFGFILCIVMCIWKWGTNLQLAYVMKNKTNLDNIFITEEDDENDRGDDSGDSTAGGDIAIDSSRSSARKRKNNDLRLKTNQYPVVRLPGIGLFYNEVASGIPITFSHFINHLPSLPEILIFITIRPLAIPYVGEEDRLVVQKIGKYKGFYRIIARYGYMESISQDKEFIKKIADIIRNDDIYNDDKEIGVNVNHDVVTYIVSTQKLDPKPNSNWFRKALLEFYMFLINNSRQLYGNWNIPIEDVIDVGMKIAV